eukprot:PhF_6_TR11051/c0_g1_i2/m.17937
MTHAPPSAPTAPSYIRPTHGLGMRFGGNGLGNNLENLGGRILIATEAATHKERMKKVKSTINSNWGHAHASPAPGGVRRRPQSASRPGTAGSPMKATTTNDMTSSRGMSSPPRRTGGQSTNNNTNTTLGGGGGGLDARGSVFANEFDVAALPADHQRVYMDLVSMLVSMTTDESRVVLEAAYKESEERKLLASYTGVFPTLADDDVVL